MLLLVIVAGGVFLRRPSVDGIWVAPHEFCKDAELSLFMLGLNGSTGYLVVANADGILINAPVHADLQLARRADRGGCHIGHLTLQTDDDDAWTDEILPRELEVKYWPQRHKLMFHSGDSVCAVLFKDFELSDMLKK